MRRCDTTSLTRRSCEYGLGICATIRTSLHIHTDISVLISCSLSLSLWGITINDRRPSWGQRMHALLRSLDVHLHGARRAQARVVRVQKHDAGAVRGQI